MTDARKKADVRDVKTYRLTGKIVLPEHLEQKLHNNLADDIAKGRFKIPPLPRVVIDLHELAQSSNPDINRAIQLIQRDPQLAAKALQVASSAAYRRFGPVVTDLKKAVVRIGVSGLRDIAFVILLGQVFRCGPLDRLMRLKQRHAFVVACCAGYICAKLRLDKEYGFLCGLMHDIGHMAIFAALADLGKRDKRWLDEDFINRPFIQLHQNIGALVIKQWKLPPLIEDVTRFHHTPSEAGAAMPMVMAVAVADLADTLEAKTLGERIKELESNPLGYQAGMDKDQLIELAELAEKARNDAEMLVLLQ